MTKLSLSTNNRLVEILGGVVAIVAAAAGVAYFDLVMSAVPAVPVVPKGYTASIITKEIQPGGVFAKVAQLLVPASAGQSGNYSTGDIGKSDLTQLE